MEPILIVLGIILIIVVGGGLWLYAGRRRGQVPDEVSAHKPMSVEDLLPSEEDEDEEPTGEGAAGAEASTAPAATLESPESIPGRMQRLRARLAGAGGFGKAVLSVLSRGDLTEEDWEEIEDTLLTSDLGIEVTTSLMDELRTQAKVLGTSDPEAVRTVLRAELLKLVDPSLDRSLNLERPTPAEGAQGKPAAAIAAAVPASASSATLPICPATPCSCDTFTASVGATPAATLCTVTGAFWSAPTIVTWLVGVPPLGCALPLEY